MSRDHMLGRARRAVLAVSRRRTGDPEASPRHAAPPRPEPTAGLPPRIERQVTAGVPPRIEREPTAELPPRIERAPTAGLPPRIEREPVSEPLPPIAPEPVAAPEPPKEPPPRPPRSPRRAGLRAHLWLTTIVLVVLAVGASGYWVLRVHQRIGETALEHQVGNQQEGTPRVVRCSELQSDGAVWACAVVYQVESVCLIAKVNAFGSWSTVVGEHRCAQVPELVALLPRTTTAVAVGTDVGMQEGWTGKTICLKERDHKVRWACQRPPSFGANCVVVRVVLWTPWNVMDGGKYCAKFPALQRAVAAAGE